MDFLKLSSILSFYPELLTEQFCQVEISRFLLLPINPWLDGYCVGKKDQFISFNDDFERNIKDVANFLYSNMSNIREKFSFPQCDSDLTIFIFYPLYLIEFYWIQGGQINIKTLSFCLPVCRIYPDLLDRIVRKNTMKIWLQLIIYLHKLLWYLSGIVHGT